MRPAVHASFLKNRGLYNKRRKRTHVFSPRRLLFMAVFGVVMFIPGLALTIVGLQNSSSESDNMNYFQKIMYQAVGPVMGIMGIVVIFGSCIYFNCYGTAPNPPAALNNQQSPVAEQDPDDKGSIRSKQRDQSQQHQQLYNGRSVDVHTPDNETRIIITDEHGTGPNTHAPHRTSGASDEEVPLAKMEDTEVLTKGQ